MLKQAYGNAETEKRLASELPPGQAVDRLTRRRPITTISDDHLPHHDREALAALRSGFGAWDIQFRPGGLPVFTAERKSGDGRSIRYLVAHSPAELAAKLETAGTVAP